LAQKYDRQSAIKVFQGTMGIKDKGSSISSLNIQISVRKAKRKEKRNAKLRSNKSRIPANDLYSKESSSNPHQGSSLITHKKRQFNHSTSLEDSIVKSKRIRMQKTIVGAQSETKDKNGDLPGYEARKTDSRNFSCGMNEETLAAQQADDELISNLEVKLGIRNNKKGKDKLHKEFSLQEGFGSGFGAFLDSLDNILDGDPMNHVTSSFDIARSDCESSSCDSHQNDMARNMLSMHVNKTERSSLAKGKAPCNTSESDLIDYIGVVPRFDSAELHKNNDYVEDKVHSLDTSICQYLDHENTNSTYNPSKGQDIYGRLVENNSSDDHKSKYTPPALRPTQKLKPGAATFKNDFSHDSCTDPLIYIKRALNGILNRLSEDSLDSVTSKLSQLYCQPNQIESNVSQCLLEQIIHTCVSRDQLFGNSLIPLYAAVLASIHLKSTTVGSYFLESLTALFLHKHERARDSCNIARSNIGREEHHLQNIYSKESSNLILFLSYLYNFDVVYCNFIYDVVKDLISAFTEVDVEALLLIIEHSGFKLLSDDPKSLKSIVLLLKERANSDVTIGSRISPRVRYMISEICDLTGNKQKKQKTLQNSKINRYRLFLMRVKKQFAESNYEHNRTATECLRISLEDIKNAKFNGRWWKVGSSWRTNQVDDSQEMDCAGYARLSGSENEEESVMQLSKKLRLSSNGRQSIFCALMGSQDVDEALEKLFKLGLKSQHQVHEAVLVLVECCAHEEKYNPFYAILATRLRDCVQKRRLTLTTEKVFCDVVIKKFDTMALRSAANTAKLYAELVKQSVITLASLQMVDEMTDLPEAGLVFFTIAFSQLFDNCDVKTTKSLFEIFCEDDTHGNALRENLLLFFLKYLQKSPQNLPNTRFRDNLLMATKTCQVMNGPD